MPETEDEPPSQSELDDLGKRLGEARGDQSDPESDGGRGTSIGLAFRLTTELVAGLVVGGAIGWFLDRWLGTTPWFLLIFFLLGMAAGIVNVIRTAQQMNAAASAENDNEDEAGGN